jgi:predicted PurR-regulated permease PerM
VSTPREAAREAAKEAAGSAEQAGKAAEHAAAEAQRAERAAAEAERAEQGAEHAEHEAERAEHEAEAAVHHLGEPGPPLKHSPFYIGFFGAAGAVLAVWLGQQLMSISSVLVMIVVSLFLAAGLNPMVEWFMRRGMRRSFAVVAVISIVLFALFLFIAAIAPVISEQIAALTKSAPDWLDELQRNRRVQKWNNDYQIIEKAKDYIASGGFTQKAFGGALGFGLAVLGALFNTFVIVVLTLYFLASLPKTKAAMYRLAPESRRDRVTRLGDQIIRSIGGYVSGAFIVAMCAGLSSLVFLFAVGLGKYAVALAFVVALLDVIPMIGATLGAVVVTAIGFATDPKIGLFCLIFYIVYQQVENYAIYPRVMSKAVDIPGAVTVIAALVGAALLGVVGALLAIPTAAAILMLTKEVFVRRQDAR